MSSVDVRGSRKIYFERFIFMAALLIPTTYTLGARVLFVCASSVLLCMLTDWVCCLIRRREYDAKDYAVPFWGLAAGMLMPVSIPFAQIVISAVICIALGKHIFGDSDNIIFSPPAIAGAFLIICYPAEMLYYPKAGETYPMFAEFTGSFARSVEYTISLGNEPDFGMLDIVLGAVPGAIGAVCILVIAVCGVCMLVRGSNSTCAVISCLVTTAVLAFFYPRIDVGGLKSVFYELTSGYMLFGIMFLSAEPFLLPKHRGARVIYGVVLGYTAMMFRNFGKAEGDFLFALLITSAMSCCFDTIIENLSYWKKTYLNSYEHSRKQVQHGGVKLTDTQEIQLPEKYRYNTPPIDSVVKRHRRRRKEDKNGRK